MKQAGDGSGGIVVLGAGYGGLRAALTLDGMAATRSGLPVTLIDQSDSHELITEIHRVAAGQLEPTATRIALETVLAKRTISFTQGRVETVDTGAARVVLAGGATVPYSHLVIALGSDVEDHNVVGVREHALTLSSVADAERIWARLRSTMDEVSATGPGAARIALETVIVVGAGWTGTELVGELISFRDAERRVGGVGGTLRIVVLEARQDMMPGFSPRLARAARTFFERSGVDLRLGSTVLAVREGGVDLTGDVAIAGGTVIWTGGVRGAKVLQETGLPLGRAQRLEVNSYLRVPGHRTIYAVGDCAVPPGEIGGHMPGPSAQLALHQGEIAAANLAADLTARPPLTYRPFLLGESLSLGEKEGVTLVGPLLVQGRRALAIKRAVNVNYVRTLLGAERALDALRLGI